MGNIRDVDSFESLWLLSQADKIRDLVKTCPKNCWMVGTAAPVMKKYFKYPIKWVLKNKLKSLAGKKNNRSCLPDQYPVDQDPQQGDLRGREQFSVELQEDFPASNDQRFMTKVLANEQLTPDAFRLRLKKGDFQFIPGQNVSIGPYLRYEKNRDYTLCSSPTDDYLEFLIKEVKAGEISLYLKKLKPGDKVEIVGPYGDFFVFDKPGMNHLFVATGVGIGPFLSFIKTYPKLNYKVIHGIRNKEDRILAEGITQEKYTSCITRDNSGDFKGRVTNYIERYGIKKNTLCYICGNPYMTKQIHSLLIKKGLPINNIFTEAYYIY